eukprot:SAG31_NODE_757_length_12296_cov_8.840289_8_plen_218_part_00
MQAKISTSILTLVQTTSYPLSPEVKIRVGLSTAATFALWIRIASWSEKTVLSVNGDSIKAPAGQYAKILRNWADGDEISIAFDFRVRCWSNHTDLVGLTVTCDQPSWPSILSLPNPTWSSSIDGKWPNYGKRFGSRDDIIYVRSGPAIGAGATTMCGWIAHVPHMKGTPGAFNNVVRPMIVFTFLSFCLAIAEVFDRLQSHIGKPDSEAKWQGYLLC